MQFASLLLALFLTRPDLGIASIIAASLVTILELVRHRSLVFHQKLFVGVLGGYLGIAIITAWRIINFGQPVPQSVAAKTMGATRPGLAAGLQWALDNFMLPTFTTLLMLVVAFVALMPSRAVTGLLDQAQFGMFAMLFIA